MSTTDIHGNIRYANVAFLEVSGFSREELRDQPHNIVRHPDMPREAFADMWKTLKAGEPWSALVNNRRKNGDHYWVRANAVPVIRAGRHEGYMSVRTKPSADEIRAAETLYKGLCEGTHEGSELHKGILLRTDWGGIPAAFQRMSVRNRIRVNFAAVAVPIIAGLMLTESGAAALYKIGVAALMMLAGSLLLELQLARPLEQMHRQALDVATGNSRDVVPMNRIDEIGMTMRSISQLGLMFRWLIDDVSQQVMHVKNSAAEIAQGNMDLSSRTEQSSSSASASTAHPRKAAVHAGGDAATAQTRRRRRHARSTRRSVSAPPLRSYAMNHG